MEKLYLLPTTILILFSLHLSAQNKVATSPTSYNNPDFSIAKDTIKDKKSADSDKLAAGSDSRIPKKRKTKKLKRKADKQFQQLAYSASMQTYQSLSVEQRKDATVLAQLANSHRLNNNTEDAEYWYQHLIEQSKDPEHLLHYAQALQSNGKCKEAQLRYREYEQLTSDSDEKHPVFIIDCDDTRLQDFNSDRIEIRNVKELNTEHLEFSPIPYKNGIVFTSTRGRIKLSKENDNWSSDNFSDLFYAELNEEGQFTEPRPFIGTANGRFHDGTATFNTGENNMYFTRSNKKGKNKKGHFELKIFSSQYKDGNWSKTKELPFNDKDFTSCHPSISYNGRTLYFASNRPGGYGGMDIYSSTMQAGGWTEPKNLGPAINTSGNELFPFIDADGQLYFSSNGHKGLGGLDIFKTQKVDPHEITSWLAPQNLGKPFNSSKDDFGFYSNPEKTEGYFSSSRVGGKGKDDLYAWRQNEEDIKKQEEPDEPVATTTEKMNTITYQPIITYVPYDPLKELNLHEYFLGDANAKFKKGQTITLNNVYYDYGKYNIRSDASTDLDLVVKLMKSKPEMTITLEAHTDSRGRDSFNLSLSQKRADSARNYITSRGIDPNRITATGFGESRLQNHCENGVNCTESAHQQNRRTEIRITQIGF